MPGMFFETNNTDPTLNLAIEEALLLAGYDQPTLFLWQNAHTVVIGRAQNAWKECRSQQLTEEGGTLVRRSTGGGAVYHDLGNLNFSFVMPKSLYAVPRQLDVISRAVAGFGIEAEASGRNDIVLSASGAKFSGNAFRHTQNTSLHHGTILMDVDMGKLGRYLQPSKAKLQAKGVESVRSRVANLKELAPHITIESLKEALFEAFTAEYGPCERLDWQQKLDGRLIAELTQKYRDWNWTYGKTPSFDISLEERFSWGGVDLQLSLNKGLVAEARAYSDANDPELATRLESALTGKAFTPRALSEDLLGAAHQEDRDVGAWLAQQAF